jgi:hypothetical protein
MHKARESSLVMTGSGAAQGRTPPGVAIRGNRTTDAQWED